MGLNYDVSADDKQRADELQIKSVKIPSGALCRFLLYDIDSPRKAKEEARKFSTKLGIMDGLDVKLVVLHFFDEEDKMKTVIDTTDQTNIQLPLGETGFKNTLWFRCSENWLRANKFPLPKDDKEAAIMFNTYIERQTNIPFEMAKNPANGGILFNAYRYWWQTEKDGKKQYNSEVTPYSKELKARLTANETDVEIISPDLTAAIIKRITNDDTPF